MKTAYCLSQNICNDSKFHQKNLNVWAAKCVFFILFDWMKNSLWIKSFSNKWINQYLDCLLSETIEVINSFKQLWMLWKVIWEGVLNIWTFLDFKLFSKFKAITKLHIASFELILRSFSSKIFFDITLVNTAFQTNYFLWVREGGPMYHSFKT